MRETAEVKSVEDLQGRDVFLVGSEEWEWTGTHLEVGGKREAYGSTWARHLVRALGKVERPIPLPTSEKYPQGFRFATDEDFNGPKPEGAMYWDGRFPKWIPTHDDIWGRNVIYAIPNPPVSSEPMAEAAQEVKCQVEACRIIRFETCRVVRLPVDQFEIGDVVLVRRVQEKVQ